MKIVLIADRPHGDRVERELRALGHQVTYVQDVHGHAYAAIHPGTDWVVGMNLHTDVDRLHEKARTCGARWVFSQVGWSACKRVLELHGFPFTGQLELGTTVKETTVQADGQSFRVLLTPAEEGGFVVSVPCLPGCITEGYNESGALAAAREAIEGYRQARRAPAAALAVVPPQPPRAPFVFEGQPVGVLIEGGEPLFLAADVCRLISIGNVRDAMTRLDDDEKTKRSRPTAIAPTPFTPPVPPSWYVTEPGVYRLVMESRTPESVRFKRWVTHDVLPAIRRTGSYTAPASEPEDMVVARAFGILQGRVKLLQAENETLHHQVELAAPKVAAYEQFLDTQGTCCIQECGKLIGSGPNLFHKALARDGHIYRRPGGCWLPRQEHVDAGRMVLKKVTLGLDSETGEVRSTFQIRITSTGIAYFHKRYGTPEAA